MNFIRTIFLVAIITLATGILGARYIMSALFGNSLAGQVQRISVAGASRAATSPTVKPAIHHAMKAGRSRVDPTSAAIVTATTVPTVAATMLPTPFPTSAPTATAIPTAVAPTATATPGILKLARYWVGVQAARPGQTIAIGYVIDNQTGQTERLLLGATIKPETAASWIRGGIDDAYHDVVATVPPGVTNHERFFTIPRSLHAGTYDVAWGLKDASTGARTALAVAAGAFQVVRR